MLLRKFVFAIAFGPATFVALFAGGIRAGGLQKLSRRFFPAQVGACRRVNRRLFGSWSVVLQPTANDAFAKYLECQGMPASISQLMANSVENRFFTVRKNAKGKKLMNLVIQIPHGPFPNITFKDFRLNKRFVAKYFTNGTLRDVGVLFVKYSSNSSSNGVACGLCETNFRPGEGNFHETYVYESSDAGKTLSITYKTHKCGPVTRKFAKLRDVGTISYDNYENKKKYFYDMPIVKLV